MPAWLDYGMARIGLGKRPGVTYQTADGFYNLHDGRLAGVTLWRDSNGVKALEGSEIAAVMGLPTDYYEQFTGAVRHAGSAEGADACLKQYGSRQPRVGEHLVLKIGLTDGRVEIVTTSPIKRIKI